MKKKALNNKIMILARSGRGKDTIARHLEDEHDMVQLLSMSTRKPRFVGEKTHVFITEEEANSMTDRVAETVINGCQYFATRQQFEECDIYIIDPIGLDCISKTCTDIPLTIIYVKKDDEISLQHAMARGADPEKEREIFIKRTADEDTQFSEFEALINTGDMEKIQERFPTATKLFVIENNGSVEELYEKVDEIVDLL